MSKVREDVIYEIATTDAFALIIDELRYYLEGYVNGLITLSKRREVGLQEVAKMAGRIEAMETVVSEFETLAKGKGEQDASTPR